MKYKQLMIGCSLIVVSFLSCGSDSENSIIEETNETCNALIGSVTPTGDNTTLVWADEFDVDGAPCSDNWTYDIGAGGWGNGEAQYYTRESDNVIVENGMLKITARKGLFRGSEYTSTRLKTQDKYSFTYGKVEVRAKLPDGGGTWPAIWMLGDNISSVGWPTCGEIDIMEHTGNELGITSSAIHTLSGNSGNPAFVSHYDKVDDVATAFHVYGINWTVEKIEFTVDGVIKGTYAKPANSTEANWPFFNDQFLILNIAMGGNLGGVIDSNFDESSMEIDYVRVYQ